MSPALTHPFAWIAAAAILALVGASPAIALLAGLIAGILIGAPEELHPARWSKRLLQASVVLLGFGMQIGAVAQVGVSSAGMTLLTVSATLVLAALLGRLMRVEREVSTLIGAGTAICGGSAIAAVAPAIGASPVSTAVSLSVVFVLNGVALLLFPWIGRLLGMTQQQFGLWAAIAIHDTSSVVGAAAAYGSEALGLATVVKLTRALWIAPVAFVAARLRGGDGAAAKVQWFLIGFVAASVIAWLVPAPGLWSALAGLGKTLMTPTLFMVGATLTPGSLRTVGARPLLMGVVLWAIVSMTTAALVLGGVLHVG
ncbi:MAG: putative sulfate exporter family transporter [Coriobacteriia bacterium]|nr:putative sulfate exporter family transporter [Coriobacteriia bacterium]MBN2839917.1 putative sulfate exporter family transporter [Coriobacteriia bacterium]